MNPAGILLCTWVLLISSLAENFHPERTRLIDYYPHNGTPKNFLFRGNMPAINGTFAYKQLLQSMSTAATQTNVTLPQTIFLMDISYLNIFEEKDLRVEKEFFSTNPSLGKFDNKWIVGTLLPPPENDTSLIEKFVKDYENIMSFDKLPDVMVMLHSLLINSTSPVVIYTHCEAGVDRTGEVSGSYYMKYRNMTFAEAFKVNHDVESRDMKKMSINAMQWYCFYLKYVEGLSSVGDCLLPY